MHVVEPPVAPDGGRHEEKDSPSSGAGGLVALTSPRLDVAVGRVQKEVAVQASPQLREAVFTDGRCGPEVRPAHRASNVGETYPAIVDRGGKVEGQASKALLDGIDEGERRGDGLLRSPRFLRRHLARAALDHRSAAVALIKTHRTLTILTHLPVTLAQCFAPLIAPSQSCIMSAMNDPSRRATA